MMKHNEDLESREMEIESMRIANSQKEQEKVGLKQKLDDARKEIN